MGPGPFEAAVTEALGKAEATSLLASLVASSRGPASETARGRGTAGRGGGSQVRGRGAGPRPSIRDQMMAARRKQEEGRRAVVAAGAAGPGGGDGEGLAPGGVSAATVNVAGSEGDGFVILT